MDVGAFGHLVQAEIDPAGRKYVQQTDVVLSGCAGPQKREGFDEPGGSTHVLQDVGDPGIWNAHVQIEDKLFSSFGYGGIQYFDMKRTILDAAPWNGSRTGRGRKKAQPFGHLRIPVPKAVRGAFRHCQPGGFGDRVRWNQDLLDVTVSA